VIRSETGDAPEGESARSCFRGKKLKTRVVGFHVAMGMHNRAGALEIRPEVGAGAWKVLPCSDCHVERLGISGWALLDFAALGDLF
jgi:hypothetical protein